MPTIVCDALLTGAYTNSAKLPICRRRLVICERGKVISRLVHTSEERSAPSQLSIRSTEGW